MKKILGISAFYHDAATALIIGDDIVAAAQEERFTRKKHTKKFPIKAIQFCLEEAKLTLNDLDAIVFYDKPLLKFERLLQTYYSFAPKGLLSFLKAMPVWISEKIFLKRLIYQKLKEVQDYDKKQIELLFSEHHLSHAASTFFVSPYHKAAILTIDGVGEWSTATISVGEGNSITTLKELSFPHSVGLLYSAFTYYLGFKVNSGEYKVMGLAPYGEKKSKQVANFISIIKEHLVKINDDGSIWLDQSYFNYATGLTMVKEKKWKQLFGFPRRKPESELKQYHCDLALAIQEVTEEIVLKMAVEAKQLVGGENLCLAGGVALNCVANGKLVEASVFDNIYIQPAAGDAGGALGAALAINHMYFGTERNSSENIDLMKGAYLGPNYAESAITKMAEDHNAVYEQFDSFDDLTNTIASKLEEGSIVGWFQGKMEFGPRALGNRSILGDPRNPEMQQKINLKIKYRESFRPFAPSVLAEDANAYFDLDTESPYMLKVAQVVEQRRIKNDSLKEELSLKDRLAQPRSDIPAVTHLDYSSRVQTVHKTTNPVFWKLLDTFKKKTGDGVLINTSFNVRGEPIVCSPEDAYQCFMNTEMDYLVIEEYVFDKKKQVAIKKKEKPVFKKD